MKSLASLIIILLVLLVPFYSIQGQAQTAYGVKLLYNYSSFSNTEASEVKLGSGFSFGGFVELTPKPNSWWHIEMNLLLNHKESNASIPEQNLQFTYKYTGLALPLYFCGKIELNQGSLFCGIGPFCSYNFNIDVRNNNANTSQAINKERFRAFDTGLATVFGYALNKHWQMNGGYRFGMLDLDSAPQNQMYSALTFIGLGYRF